MILHMFTDMQELENLKEADRTLRLWSMDWMLHHQYADPGKANSNYEYMNSNIMEDFIQHNVATIRK